MITFIIKTIVSLVGIALIIAFARTWQMENSANQLVFAKGTVPTPIPDGLYKGTVPGHEVSWLGKKFASSTSSGINVFSEESTTTEKYPFKTSLTKGLRDRNLDVVKIDYNQSPNPFWLRFVVDEIVETAPAQYLGKLHINIYGFTFTLAYFELKK